MLSLIVSCIMTNDKPFVQVATFTDKVLREEGGVLSAIRIVDRFTVHNKPPITEVKGVFETTLLVCLKSGDVTGEYELKIRHRRPSGKQKEFGKYPIVLKGGVHGFNLVARLTFAVQEFGLHWFDVMWQDAVLTSIPLMLVDGSQEAEGE